MFEYQEVVDVAYTMQKFFCKKISSKNVQDPGDADDHLIEMCKGYNRKATCPGVPDVASH